MDYIDRGRELPRPDRGEELLRVRHQPDFDLTERYGPAADGERATAAPNPARAALSVGFILLPQFTLLAFAGFIEALRHAADIRDRSRQIHCRWSVLGPDQRPVRSSCGVAVSPWEVFAGPIPYDYIAVVGGLLSGHDSVNPAVLQYVRRAAAKAIPLIGLCTGSFLLARAGLMEGRRCCVSYYHASEFQQEFGSRNITVAADELFTVDGPRITCAGGLGVVDLAVYLLERHLGAQRAQKSIVQMIFDSARPPTAPQPRFEAASYSAAHNPIARRAVLLMELNISEPLSVNALAEQLGISVKKLERLFQSEFALSPASLYRKIRLEIAQRLLKETTRPVINVALECGFGDISYFGRAFRSVYGLCPREFRRRQSALPPACADTESLPVAAE